MKGLLVLSLLVCLLGCGSSNKAELQKLRNEKAARQEKPSDPPKAEKVGKIESLKAAIDKLRLDIKEDRERRVDVMRSPDPERYLAKLELGPDTEVASLLDLDILRKETELREKEKEYYHLLGEEEFQKTLHK